MNNNEYTNKVSKMNNETLATTIVIQKDLQNNQTFQEYPSLDDWENNSSNCKQSNLPNSSINFNLFKSSVSPTNDQSSTKEKNSELNNLNNRSFHFSILEGKLNNSLKKSKILTTLFSSQSGLVGTEQLLQFKETIKQVIQSNLQDNEFLKVKILPYTTSKDYNNCMQKNDDHKLYQQIKTYLYSLNYFSQAKFSDSICYFVDIDTFSNKFYSQFISKGTGLNCQQLKEHIYYWRKVRGDGNCYYRSIIFRYLEILILNGQIDLLKDFAIDMYNSLQGELNKMLKITPHIIINPHHIILIMKLIISELESNNRENAYQIFLKALNMEKKIFDLALVLYFRYMLMRYIKENENKLYLKEFDIQIGNLLPIEFETEDGQFLFNNFYEKYLMKMFVYAEKIVIYLTPFVLGMSIDVLLYEDKDDPLKKMRNVMNNIIIVNDPKKQFLSTQRIYILNFNSHYDLIYTKREFEEVMKYADKQLIYNENMVINKVNKDNNLSNNKEQLNTSQLKQEATKNQENVNTTTQSNQTKKFAQSNIIHTGNSNYNITQQCNKPNQNNNKQNHHRAKELSSLNQNEQNINIDQHQKIVSCPRFNNINDCWKAVDNYETKNQNLQSKNQKLDNPKIMQNQNQQLDNPKVIQNQNKFYQNSPNLKKSERNVNQLNTNKHQNSVNHQYYEIVMTKEYENNISEIQLLRKAFITNKRLNLKEKINILKNTFYTHLQQKAANFSLSVQELLSIYSQIKGNICVICNKEINKNQIKEDQKLPCGCVLCSKNCINQFCDNFFLEILRCICFFPYNPSHLASLQNILAKNFPNHQHIKCIENKIKHAFETTCCICEQQKPQKELKNYSLNFSNQIPTSKVTEVLEILWREIKNHKICDNCKNNNISKESFECKLCKLSHSFKQK